MAIQVINMSNGCVLEENRWWIKKGDTYFGIGEPVGFTSPIYTVEFALNFQNYSSSTTNRYLIGDFLYNGTTAFAFYIKSSKLYAVYVGSDGATKTITGPTLTVGNNYIVQLVVDSDHADLYVNGALVGTYSYGGAFGSGDAGSLGLHIAYHATEVEGHNYLGVYWYGLAFYQKALNVDEIATNVQAYIDRYGLTL